MQFSQRRSLPLSTRPRMLSAASQPPRSTCTRDRAVYYIPFSRIQLQGVRHNESSNHRETFEVQGCSAEGAAGTWGSEGIRRPAEVGRSIVWQPASQEGLLAASQKGSCSPPRAPVVQQCTWPRAACMLPNTSPRHPHPFPPPAHLVLASLSPTFYYKTCFTAPLPPPTPHCNLPQRTHPLCAHPAATHLGHQRHQALWRLPIHCEPGQQWCHGEACRLDLQAGGGAAIKVSRRPPGAARKTRCRPASLEQQEKQSRLAWDVHWVGAQQGTAS